MEVSDIDGYDWNWGDKYRDEVVEELTDAYVASFMESLEPDVEVKLTLSRNHIQRAASAWAILEAEQQLLNYSESTRQGVMEVIAEGLEAGRSLQEITRFVRDDFLFSAKRARVIARTETARALGQGQKGAAKEQGRDEKRWMNSGDIADAGEWCVVNTNVGWISSADSFPSGVDTIPQHPNCRCIVRYRTKELHDVIASFRCVGCNKLLGKDVHTGTRIVCRSCKLERIAEVFNA